MALLCGARPARQTCLLGSLTRREQQIARPVAEGMSDVAIATALGISEHTVGAHLYRVYRKLGLHSRVELANVLRAESCAPPSG